MSRIGKEVPNILHIVTDQQRFDTIGALGNQLIQTPHLDALCREGTTFTRAYTPTAECVPARACMITGMYADKTGCGSNADPMPEEQTPTLMSRLTDGGYRTHGVGKCHFTPDPSAMRGFQTRDTSEEIVADPSKDDYLQYLKEYGYDHLMEPHGSRGEMYYIPQPSPLPEKHHHTHWVGDRCLDFVNREGSSDQPWYLYAGFIAPHPPFAPPNPWNKLYRAPEMPFPYLPENADELTCFVNRFQNRYKYRDRGMDLNLVRCIRAYYYASISFIDYQIGRMMESLRRTGLLDRTLILFTADHGELLGDFGCFGKRSFHDACMRIPMLVRYPKRFQAGTKCRAPASLVDLLPTFLKAAGLPTPVDCDGVDLAGLAIGKEQRKAVHLHYAHGENAIIGAINGTHKYAWSAPDQKEYLFTTKDSCEKQNLMADTRSRKEADSLMQSVLKRASQHAFSGQLVSEKLKWQLFPVRKMPSDPDKGLLYQDPTYAEAILPDEYKLEYPRENFLGY